MYKKLSKLTEENTAALVSLFDEIELNSRNIRPGANAEKRLSIYKSSRWYEWNRTQKNHFKALMPTNYVNQSVVGWYLHFPANTGFLDLMTAWQDTPVAGHIVAYALTSAEIIINGETVRVQAGDGIAFCLSEPHEVKPKAYEQNWACLMLLNMPK